MLRTARAIPGAWNVSSSPRHLCVLPFFRPRVSRQTRPSSTGKWTIYHELDIVRKWNPEETPETPRSDLAALLACKNRPAFTTRLTNRRTIEHAEIEMSFYMALAGEERGLPSHVEKGSRCEAQQEPNENVGNEKWYPCLRTFSCAAARLRSLRVDLWMVLESCQRLELYWR